MKDFEAVKRGEPINEEIVADYINELLRRNHEEPSDEFK